MRHSPSVSSALNSNPSTPIDELARVFNTALIGTLKEGLQDFSSEIYSLVESPAFRAILDSVHQHARLQGISDRQSAEQIIGTFRKMDRLWSDYVFQEGIDRLKNAASGA